MDTHSGRFDITAWHEVVVMNKEDIEKLADEIIDDIRTWNCELEKSPKEWCKVWDDIKKDITRTLCNTLIERMDEK